MADQSYNPIELITIQANYPYSDPIYGPCDNWKTFCQVYAELQIGAGREFFGAKSVNPQLSGIVKTMQYIRGVSSSMRVICSRGIFNIIGPPIDKRELNSIEIHLKSF